MKLLSPDDIHKDRSESIEGAAARSRALAAEESRLARAINQAREDAQQQIKIIEADFAAFKADLLEQKNQLVSEVRELENRKTEALKPVEPIKAAAAAALAEAESAKTELERQRADLEKDKEKNQERAENLHDSEQVLDERSRLLDQREQRINAEQQRIEHSAKALGDKWAEYHQAVAQLNDKVREVTTREAEVEAGKKANDDRAGKLREWESSLGQKQNQLEDGYRNLAKARKEILGRDD